MGLFWGGRAKRKISVDTHTAGGVEGGLCARPRQRCAEESMIMRPPPVSSCTSALFSLAVNKRAKLKILKGTEKTVKTNEKKSF